MSDDEIRGDVERLIAQPNDASMTDGAAETDGAVEEAREGEGEAESAAKPDLLEEEWVRVNETVPEIEIRIIQSLGDKILEDPFFNAYSDQDLVTTIYNLLLQSDVDESLLHAKAHSYYNLIKRHIEKLQAEKYVKASIIPFIEGSRKDNEDLEQVLADMDPKQNFAQNQNTLNNLYLPIDSYITDENHWTPKQDIDVSLGGDDMSSQVRVLKRDNSHLQVNGFFKVTVDPSRNRTALLHERMDNSFKQTILSFEDIDELNEPLERHLEKRNKIDINGFIKHITEVLNFHSLGQLLYEHEGVALDELNHMQQMVIFFHLMKLADLEKPLDIESSEATNYMPRVRKVNQSILESVEIIQRIAKDYEPTLDEYKQKAKEYQVIISDHPVISPKTNRAHFQSPYALFNALIKPNSDITLEVAIEHLQIMIQKRNMELAFTFVRDLGKMDGFNGLEEMTASMQRLRMSLKDEHAPLVRTYEAKYKGKQGTRTFFLEDVGAGMVADEQHHSDFVMEEGALDGGDESYAEQTLISDFDDEGFGIATIVNVNDINASVREHVVLLLRYFNELSHASQLPIDLVKMTEMFNANFKVTSRMFELKKEFGLHFSDEMMKMLLSNQINVQDVIAPEIEDDLQAKLKEINTTFKTRMVSGFMLGITWWIIELQTAFSNGQSSLDPISYGCKPLWAFHGPPMSDFQEDAGIFVFLMCSIRFLWEPENSPWRTYFTDIVSKPDHRLANSIVLYASKYFSTITGVLQNDWNERLQALVTADRKHRVSSHITTLRKLVSYDSTHIKAYKAALINLPSIIASQAGPRLGSLMSLKNTCCTQSLNKNFKAYSDISALDKISDILMKRQSRFADHYKLKVRSQQNLAKLGWISAQEEGDAPKPRPQDDSMKSIPDAISIVKDDVSPYYEYLKTLNIHAKDMPKLSERYEAHLRANVSDKAKLQSIKLKIANATVSGIIDLMNVLTINLHKLKVKYDDDGEIMIVRVLQTSIQKIIEMRSFLRAQRCVIDDEDYNEVQQFAIILFYRAMLLPGEPDKAGGIVIVNAEDMVNLQALDNRILLNVYKHSVNAIAASLGQSAVPTQKELFDYITRMRESQKTEKIAKYENMPSRSKDDMRELKQLKMFDVIESALNNANNADGTIDDIPDENPYAQALADNDMVVFSPTDGDADEMDEDALNDGNF
jgi:hypothetical protein